MSAPHHRSKNLAVSVTATRRAVSMTGSTYAVMSNKSYPKQPLGNYSEETRAKGGACSTRYEQISTFPNSLKRKKPKSPNLGRSNLMTYFFQITHLRQTAYCTRGFAQCDPRLPTRLPDLTDISPPRSADIKLGPWGEGGFKSTVGSGP